VSQASNEIQANGVVLPAESGNDEIDIPPPTVEELQAIGAAAASALIEPAAVEGQKDDRFDPRPLIAAIQNSEPGRDREEAIEAYWRWGQPILARYLTRILSNTEQSLADDFISDTFIKILRSVQRITPGEGRESPSAFLRVTCLRLVLDHRKNLRVRRELLAASQEEGSRRDPSFDISVLDAATYEGSGHSADSPLVGPALSVERSLMQSPLRALLSEVLDEMERPYGYYLRLQFLEGRTEEEIARHMSIGVSTLRSKQKTGLRKLREFLRNHPKRDDLMPYV